ncbi:MAG: hypothetical protein R6V05_04770 [Candidatus Brocadiia bacterium]
MVEAQTDDRAHSGAAAEGFEFSDGFSYLTSLPPHTIIFEKDLMKSRGCSADTIRRAWQERGELPPPVRLWNHYAWTVRSITEHMDRRLRRAGEERARMDDGRSVRPIGAGRV